MATWTSEQLRQLDAAQELRIAPGAPADRQPARPIWVVTAGSQVYVRTWHRRTTGWFGRALASGVAGIDVPGFRAEVTVTDVGVGTADLRAAVDDAYRRKYGGGGTGGMLTDESAATTLRLDP